MRGVPQHAAHQADIGPAGVIAIFELQLQQGFDIELELPLIGNISRHFGVKPMQAVDQDDLILVQTHGGMIGVGFPGFKVIEGNAHFFSLEELRQVLIDQLHVQGLWGLKIIIAKFILWMHLKVEEIVINVECDQFETLFCQMFPDFDGGGGFSAGTGADDEDHPHLVLTIEDQVGSVFNVFTVSCF